MHIYMCASNGFMPALLQLLLFLVYSNINFIENIGESKKW